MALQTIAANLNNMPSFSPCCSLPKPYFFWEKALIKALFDGKELPAGVVLSQVISNVTAAILLSGFTDKSRALLYGVNIGELGTLIASLASVISYRLYGNSLAARKEAYLKTFTVYNLVFLAILYVAAMLPLSR